MTDKSDEAILRVVTLAVTRILSEENASAPDGTAVNQGGDRPAGQYGVSGRMSIMDSRRAVALRLGRR